MRSEPRRWIVGSTTPTSLIRRSTIGTLCSTALSMRVARAYDAAGNSTTSAPVSVTLANDFTPPTVSLTDHARKIVIARLGNRLRVAGTAELAAFVQRLGAR